VDSVVYGCTDVSEVWQYGSILTITLTDDNSTDFTSIRNKFKKNINRDRQTLQNKVTTQFKSQARQLIFRLIT